MATMMFDHLENVPHAASLYQPEAVLEPIQEFGPLSADQMDQYRSAGFLSYRSFLSAARIAEVKQTLMEIAAREELPPEVQLQFESDARGKVEDLPIMERMDYVRKFMIFAHLDVRIQAVMHDPVLLQIVSRLLDGEPEMFQDMALLKPAGIGREKPWHQDHAYFNLPEGTPVVGVWIALDDATPENGCMHFIPGGHREGPIAHFNRRDWQICDEEILNRKGVVATPLPAGGVLIFDGLTPHGTPANRSERSRWALQFHYVKRRTPRISTEERFEMFGADRHESTC